MSLERETKELCVLTGAACVSQREGCTRALEACSLETCFPADVRTRSCLWEGSRVCPVHRNKNLILVGSKFHFVETDREGPSGDASYTFTTGSIISPPPHQTFTCYKYTVRYLKKKNRHQHFLQLSVHSELAQSTSRLEQHLKHGYRDCTTKSKPRHWSPVLKKKINILTPPPPPLLAKA